MTKIVQVGEGKLKDLCTRRWELTQRKIQKQINAIERDIELAEHRRKMLEEIEESCVINLSEGDEAWNFFFLKVEEKTEKMVENATWELNRDLNKALKLIKRQDEEIEKLRSELGKKSKAEIDSSRVAIERAKTFAIIDSTLFSIENWAVDDSPAPDITLALQATIFPVLLEKVSSGDENYYLSEVPSSALEVVKRGREFVRNFREKEHISILDPTGWEVLQPLLHTWWTRDAMPMLYGEGFEGWEEESPYTLDEMTRWRNMEAARPLEFPLIFDGFELVKKYGDEIRLETGLPEFSRQTQQTRIQAHD